ncbi:hypothetical protein SAMN05216298_3611 [Glycomyces sambucus]|uniref:Uncharacterized protein n=1 Tax=Glycomyces sambucus TaxID=380244 RepID=A0A1G9JG07_9ACTN|nr:hypothetical protein [Glycomyces sambucus]SDL36232.1 hypothetical protein SAMN05216298_3611 [Glycomyces sambucus]
MRRPNLIGTAAASAAAAVLAGSVFTGGTTAHAETPAAFEDAAAPSAVTLPTGDRVTLLPNGTTAIEPAAGREDATFLTPPAGGDVVVVPTDRVAAVASGDEDPRRYNVSELLRAGETDAAAAPESELDDRAYAGLVPDTGTDNLTAAADLEKLNLTLLNRGGKAPDGSWILWSARDGSDFDAIPIDENGNGGVALPVGDYIIVSGFWSDPTDTTRGHAVLGMTPVTVTEGGTELVLDGADARPVSIDVEEPDASVLNAALHIGASGANTLGSGIYLGSQVDAFVLPEPDLPDYALDFVYQPVLTGPADADDPYVYNLAFLERGGYPADTEFSVADDDLAAVATDYTDLGTAYGAAEAETCDYGDHVDGWIGTGFCTLVPTAVPSQRTVYYTADPEVNWDNGLMAGPRTPDGVLTDGFVATSSAVYEPGPAERLMPRGGLSAGVSEGFRFNDGGLELLGADLYPVGGGNGERIILAGDKGDVTLSRDGEIIATATGLDFYQEAFFTEIPAGDAGRYTISVDATEPSASRDFGTGFSAEWSFDSAPVAEGELDQIVLPVVQLSSEDIEAGYAPKRGCQEITLDLRYNEYGPVVHAEDMTFEVSYDDGRTWKAIDIDRDGDTATAELTHPRRAKWVSVRMTALDDQGTEVTHTTIRAFGLR